MKTSTSRTRLATLLLLAATLGACQSSSNPSTWTTASNPGASLAGPLPSRYAQAETGAQLAAFVQRDLAEHGGRFAYNELREFTGASLANGTATLRSSIVTEAALPTLLLFHGGQNYVTAVKALVGLLENAADMELDTAYESYLQGDAEGLRHALNGYGRVLHPDTVARAPHLQPYALFFQAALDTFALEDQASPDRELAEGVVTALDRAGRAFLNTGSSEEFFQTRLLSALALERIGEDAAAMEKWLEAAESAYWPQSGDVQLLVAGRIQSYRDRLRKDVEAEVAEAWQREVDKIEAKHQEAMQRVAELEGARDELRLALDRDRATRAVASASSPTVDDGPSGAEQLSMIADVATLADLLFFSRGSSLRLAGRALL